MDALQQKKGGDDDQGDGDRADDRTSHSATVRLLPPTKVEHAVNTDAVTGSKDGSTNSVTTSQKKHQPFPECPPFTAITLEHARATRRKYNMMSHGQPIAPGPEDDCWKWDFDEETGEAFPLSESHPCAQRRQDPDWYLDDPNLYLENDEKDEYDAGGTSFGLTPGGRRSRGVKTSSPWIIGS
ncbi:MAG: hypothetical protein M4579_001622 [Chaenotheca gracillima]|nr:MAG: hypothetical protein M4579_001622 [Chaenotheca gracillima]